MQSSEEARNKLVIFVVCTLHQVQEMLHLINIFSFPTLLKLILKLRTTKENDVYVVCVYLFCCIKGFYGLPSNKTEEHEREANPNNICPLICLLKMDFQKYIALSKFERKILC